MKLPVLPMGLLLAAFLMPHAMADTDIPPGNTTTPYIISSSGTYNLADGSNLTMTANSNYTIQATAASTVNINGTLEAVPSMLTFSQVYANALQVKGSSSTIFNVNIGANGLVENSMTDDILVKSGGVLNIDNAGKIISLAPADPDPADDGIPAGMPQPAYFPNAINANKASGASSATDRTSGGVITNESTGLIRADDGYGIDLGKNMTVNNYGTILADTPVNDTAKNNEDFKHTIGPAYYNVGRGIEFDSGNYDTVNNYEGAIIEGSGAGVDASSSGSKFLVVNNSGTIIGENGSGIGSDTTGTSASNFIVNNSATGKIYGENAGAGHILDQLSLASEDSDPDGVDIDGGATISNHGLIETTAAGSGYDANGRANTADGISIGGGNVVNYQDGRIISAQNGVTVNNDSTAGRSGRTSLNLENDGLIQANDGYAIRSENNSLATVDTDVVVNTGKIVGGTVAPDPSVVVGIEGDQQDTDAHGTLDGVTYTAGTNQHIGGYDYTDAEATYTDSTGTHTGNARFIEGDGSAIQLGQGNDVLTNTGTITGLAGKAINMEDGDDTVNVERGSQITGDINGGNGSEVNGDTLNLDLDDTLGLKQLASDGTATGTTITADPGVGNTFTFASGIVNFEHVNAVSGKTVLTGNSTYAGVTTIGGGSTAARLEQDGTHTGGGDYHVAAHGTLAGTGVVTLATAANTVTVDAGGTLAPGTENATGKSLLTRATWS